jgi:uncharacterized protein YukE
MKMMRGPLQDIVGRIAKQVDVLGDVQSRFSGFSSALQGAWIGQDAEAFVEEVQRRLIPEIADLIAAIGGMPGGLNSAMDIMSAADSKGRGMVSQLGDMFGGIF